MNESHNDQEREKGLTELFQRVYRDPRFRESIDHAYHQAINEFLRAEPHSLLHEILRRSLPAVFRPFNLTSEEMSQLVLAVKLGAQLGASKPEVTLHAVYFLLQEDPYKAKYWVDKGNYAMSISCFANALRCFDKAIQIDPANEPARQGRETCRKQVRSAYGA